MGRAASFTRGKVGGQHHLPGVRWVGQHHLPGVRWVGSIIYLGVGWESRVNWYAKIPHENEHEVSHKHFKHRYYLVHKEGDIGVCGVAQFFVRYSGE